LTLFCWLILCWFPFERVSIIGCGCGIITIIILGEFTSCPGGTMDLRDDTLVGYSLEIVEFIFTNDDDRLLPILGAPIPAIHLLPRNSATKKNIILSIDKNFYKVNNIVA